MTAAYVTKANSVLADRLLQLTTDARPSASRCAMMHIFPFCGPMNHKSRFDRVGANPAL